MEKVLVEGTLIGLLAIQDLSTSLSATAQTQRVLAQKVGPNLCPILLCPDKDILWWSNVCPQVEAMNVTGVLLGSLVHNLARLREEAMLGLKSLQAEQEKLEKEIIKAQERHQMVIDS